MTSYLIFITQRRDDIAKRKLQHTAVISDSRRAHTKPTKLSVLALLNLSAAFDTIDHDILLTQLKVSFGINGAALDWFQSYLTSRVECSAWSTHKTARFGMPQGSVLSPLLFILYTAGLIDLIEGYGLNPHLYADDTQIQGSCCPGSAIMHFWLPDATSGIACRQTSPQLQR